MVDNISDSGIKELMTRFKLIDIREQYMELIREAEKNSYSYKDFLISLLKVERDGKDLRRRQLLALWIL